MPVKRKCICKYCNVTIDKTPKTSKFQVNKPNCNIVKAMKNHHPFMQFLCDYRNQNRNKAKPYRVLASEAAKLWEKVPTLDERSLAKLRNNDMYCPSNRRANQLLQRIRRIYQAKEIDFRALASTVKAVEDWKRQN